MAKTTLILLQIILAANLLLASSCNVQNCIQCSRCTAPSLSPIPCYSTNDLVILLDSSGSIGSSNYDTAKNFVNNLATAFIPQSGSRFGFLIYSDVVNTIVSLTNTLTPSAISSAILGAPYLADTTNTNLGIDAAVAQFTSSPRAVPLNLIVLTDGVSTNPTLTVASSSAAASAGIRTFSVGIGSSTNGQELLDIANGDSNRVYTSNDFDELIELLNPISHAICSN